mgnify:CR=1 FL=1
MKEIKKFSTSIIGITLALFIFFPIGIFLIYLRLKEKHGKYYAAAKISFWLGIILVAVGLLSLIESSTEVQAKDDTAAIIIFIIPGTISFLIGSIRNNKIKKYQKCLIYISSRNKITIDELSRNMRIKYENTIKIVEEMIEREFIKGTLDRDVLIMDEVSKNYKNNLDDYNKNKDKKIVECKECGAQNTIIIGETNICEYCGTHLS